MNDRLENNKLGIAIIKEKSDHAILQLIKQYPTYVQEMNNNDEYPLYLACKYGSSETVVTQLLTRFPEAASVQGNVRGNFPLHISCYYQSEEVVLLLLNTFPHAAAVRNNDGHYPLHLACFNSKSEKVVIQLLKEYPQAAAIPNIYDHYPIQLACNCCNPPNSGVILTLMDTNLLIVKKISDDLLRDATYYPILKPLIAIIESIKNKSDYELENRIDIPMIVLVNGLDNILRLEKFQWLLMNTV
jgi:Ankyrin repeats (3 copies)